MTHKYSKCFHTCILFLINMVTCVYMGSHNHFKFKIVKENLQRVIRKLFQCNLRFVFVPGIYEWCSSAAICFMMCVPFYCFHLVSFFECQFIEYLYIGNLCEITQVWMFFSSDPNQMGKNQFQTSEICKIQLHWNFVKCSLTVMSVFFYMSFQYLRNGK